MSTVKNENKTFANSLYIAYAAFGWQTQHTRNVVEHFQK